MLCWLWALCFKNSVSGASIGQGRFRTCDTGLGGCSPRRGRGVGAGDTGLVLVWNMSPGQGGCAPEFSQGGVSPPPEKRLGSEGILPTSPVRQAFLFTHLRCGFEVRGFIWFIVVVEVVCL